MSEQKPSPPIDSYLIASVNDDGSLNIVGNNQIITDEESAIEVALETAREHIGKVHMVLQVKSKVLSNGYF